MKINIVSKYLLGLIVTLCLFSCASSTTVSFLCDKDDIQIFVNNEYVGTGLVTYTAPKDVTTAEVECKRNGVTVFSRNYYIKGHNSELFDIIIPNYNSYSSDKIIHSK